MPVSSAPTSCVSAEDRVGWQCEEHWATDKYCPSQRDTGIDTALHKGTQESAK